MPGTMLSVLAEMAHAAMDEEAAQSGDGNNAGLTATLCAIMNAALAAVVNTALQP